ncbi:MAG: S41 family peptidase [Chitinophagales bacterium]
MKKFSITYFLAGIVLTCTLLTTYAFSTNPSFFEITKNMDVFASLYKELNTYYVDELNPERLIQTGLAEMCNSLDPYSDFIPEEDIPEYRQQTTGRYGGIGAIIGTRGDDVMITEPYESFPAAKAGLRAGDKILSIDGKSAKKLNSDEVSRMLKGKPGTTVSVRVARPQAEGKDQEMDVVLTREEIKIKNVPYFGMLTNDIGYIRLSSFTEKASNEVRTALNMLEAKHQLKGLIFDLRGNPGGLLNEAINTAGVFVDKNTEIVSTRGKTNDQNSTAVSTVEPADTKVPMVVLTDGGSASAAEIVSGSMQDLDRAVIVGQQTYGKGLVQSTRSLPYNAKLKLTTAKYYIPSGRCIQAINYADRSEDGSVKRKADSLKVAFKTRNGRTVYDGVGINPDVELEPEKLSQVAIALITKNILFDYSINYRAGHEAIGNARTFTLTDKDYDDFVAYVSSKDFNYTTQSEHSLEQLKKTAEKEKVYDAILSEYNEMKQKMMHDKKQDLIKEKKQIKGILEEEIASRYTLNAGRIEASLKNDADVIKAVELLNTEGKVAGILKGK